MEGETGRLSNGASLNTVNVHAGFQYLQIILSPWENAPLGITEDLPAIEQTATLSVLPVPIHRPSSPPALLHPPRSPLHTSTLTYPTLSVRYPKSGSIHLLEA